MFWFALVSLSSYSWKWEHSPILNIKGITTFFFFSFFLNSVTFRPQSLEVYPVVRDLVSECKIRKLSEIYLDINIRVHINNAHLLFDILPFTSFNQAYFILNKSQMRSFDL